MSSQKTVVLPRTKVLKEVRLIFFFKWALLLMPYL